MNTLNIPEYKVSQFNFQIKDLIENNFNYIRISGEISEIKNASKGQLYITLKDAQSILSCVVWSQKMKNLLFNPELGMQVIATGKITTWSKYKTTYQLDIDKIELQGEGALLKLIEDRKKKLKTKGIFDEKYKKNLPLIPKKIGIITSPTGSVIHDIINKIKERFFVDIDLWPSAVQGTEAEITIIRAIKGFNSFEKKDQPDVIVIARGGGSTEDLMTFNSENIAMAVFESSIPIVSAIGHETDTTIIDYVSDLRASTPTAAAEKIVPVRTELLQSVKSIDERINYLIDTKSKIEKNYLENFNKLLKAPNKIIDIFKEKVEQNFSNINKEFQSHFEKNNILIKNINKFVKPPFVKIDSNKILLNNLYKSLNKNIIEKENLSKDMITKLSRLLKSNSIHANLDKGYSILTDNNKIIKKSIKTHKGQSIKAKLYEGELELIVKKN